LQLRNLPTGSLVGYNATYETKVPARVATLAIGYADGYRRAFSGIGEVRFQGTILRVIGRISMDLVTVDATFCPALKEGDWVDINFSLHNAAVLTGLSQYELLTGLAERAERIWSSAAL
jgi:alanine racemase